MTCPTCECQRKVGSEPYKSCTAYHNGKYKVYNSISRPERCPSTTDYLDCDTVICVLRAPTNHHCKVEAGADLGAFNKDGYTALDVASSRNHLVIECYLRTEGAFSSLEFWGAADSG